MIVFVHLGNLMSIIQILKCMLMPYNNVALGIERQLRLSKQRGVESYCLVSLTISKVSS